MRSTSRWFVLLLAILMPGCQKTEFQLDMAWDGEPPAAGTVYLSGRVEDRSLQPARVVATAPFVAYRPGVQLDFSDVPVGDERVVIVEGRAQPEPTNLPVYYGESDPFSLRAKETTRVSVRLSLRTPPGQGIGRVIDVEPTGQEPEANEAVRVNQNPVTLRVWARDARSVRISNDSGFEENQRFELENPDRCEDGGRCRYTIAGWSLGDDVQACSDRAFCIFRVWARLIDENGYESSEFSREVIYDVRSPTAQPVALTYRPPPDNPIQQPTEATVGTTIRISILASEPIAGRPQPPRLEANNGVSTLSFRLVDQDELGARFEGTVTATHTDGVYRPHLAVVDLAGNPSGELAFDTPNFVVKSAVPRLVVDQTRVSFVRSPVGTGQPEALGAYTIPAGPRFALAPADDLSNSATFEPGVFRFADGTVPRRLRVWADPNRTVRLATAESDERGAFARTQLELIGFEANAIYVTAVDNAGNESAPVAISTAWYVFTSLPSAPPDLSQVSRTYRVQEALTQPSSEMASEAIGSVDGQAEVAETRIVWQPLAPGPEPTSRAVTQVAFDEARGQMVMFSGGLFNLSILEGTWEWDGIRWREIPTLAAPPPVQLGTLTYDTWRQRVLSFGGAGINFEMDSDLWQWDGRRWTPLTVVGDTPPRRFSAATTFDTRRGELVLFGGEASPQDGGGRLGNTWLFNGETWRLGASGGPAGRTSHSMAYDEANGRVVMYGGSDEDDVQLLTTWEWDGESWTEFPASVGPRRSTLMYYDPVRRRVTMCGGNSRSGEFIRLHFECYDWQGQQWNLRPTTAFPGPRLQWAGVFDRARSEAVLFAGQRINPDLSGTFDGNDIWVRAGDGWREATAAAPDGPGARALHAVSNGPFSGQILLYGGTDGLRTATDETWLYQGSRWSQVSPANDPGLARGHMMAFDFAAGQILIYGGNDGSSPRRETWAFNGTDWTRVASATDENPGPRFRVGMASDPIRGRVVLYGDGRDTWEWNGTRWNDATPTTGQQPPELSGCALAYDAERRVMVLFGGFGTDLQPSNQVWEYDGETWMNVTPVSGRMPDPRYYHTMVYDEAKARVLVIGGAASDTEFFGDTWAWDGLVWTTVAASESPTARGLSAAAYSANHRRTVLVGGVDNQLIYGDTWETTTSSATQPALQLTANLPEDLSPSQIREVQIRAYCGGRSMQQGTSVDGAALQLWYNRASDRRSTGWQTVATHAQGLPDSPPALPPNDQSRLTYRLTDPAEVQAIIGAATGRIGVQCRPLGAATPDLEAKVAADFFEIRLRYDQP